MSTDSGSMGLRTGGMMGSGPGRPGTTGTKGAAGTMDNQIQQLRSPDPGGEIRLFNGKDLTGWNGFKKQVADPALCVGIEGGELVWSASLWGRIYPDASYRNFSLKFDYVVPPNGPTRSAHCLLRLAGGETFRLGPVDHHVSDVGFSLTSGVQGRTGDIALFAANDRRTMIHILERTSDNERTAGGWNEVEVRCESRSITFLLNGRVVNRLEGKRDILCHPGFSSWGTDLRTRNI